MLPPVRSPTPHASPQGSVRRSHGEAVTLPPPLAGSLSGSLSRSQSRMGRSPSPAPASPRQEKRPSSYYTQSAVLSQTPQGRTVMMLLEHESQEYTHSAALGPKHRMALQRRLVGLRDNMAHRLTDHMHRQGQRDAAIPMSAFAQTQDRQRIVHKWLAAVAAASFAAAVIELRRKERAREAVANFIIARWLQNLKNKKLRRARRDRIAQLKAEMPPRPVGPVLRDSTDPDSPLRAMPLAALNAMAAIMEPRCCVTGDDVVLAGVPGVEAFYVATGDVALYHPPSSDDLYAQSGANVEHSTLHYTAGPGAVVFERLLFFDGHYEVRAVAATDIRLWVVRTTRFRDLLRRLRDGTEAELFVPRPLGAHDAEAPDTFLQPRASLAGLSLTEEVLALVDVPALGAAREEILTVAGRISNECRAALLERQFRLTDPAVRSASSLFQLWSPSGVAHVMEHSKCRVLRPADDVVPRHERYGKWIVFVVAGKVEVRVFPAPKGSYPAPPPGTQPMPRPPKVQSIVAGGCVGALPCLTHRRDFVCTMIAQCDSDVWVLADADLRQAACHENAYTLVPFAMHATEEAPGTSHEGSPTTAALPYPAPTPSIKARGARKPSGAPKS